MRLRVAGVVALVALVGLAAVGCGPPVPQRACPSELSVSDSVLFGVGAEVSLPVGLAAGCSRPPTELVSAKLLDPEKNEVPLRLAMNGAGQLLAFFTPQRFGLYRLSIGPPESGPVMSSSVHVVDDHSTPFLTTTFVDRLDNCLDGPFRTLQGLTLCNRFRSGSVPLVSVYGVDGSFLSSFSGASLVVRGDSVWSRPVDSSVVELRVNRPSDTVPGGTLELIGSADVGSSGLTTAQHTSGLRATDTGYRYATARFDGTRLTVEEEPEPWPDRNGFQGVVLREGTTWWEDNCVVRYGCASMPLSCDPVRQCSEGGARQVLAVDEDGVWLQLAVMVVMMPRPLVMSLDVSTEFITFPGGPTGAVSQSPVQKGAQIPILQANEGVFLPRRDGATFHLQLVRGVTGNVRSATREFIVSIPTAQNPFVVRFDRLAD